MTNEPDRIFENAVVAPDTADVFMELLPTVACVLPVKLAVVYAPERSIADMYDRVTAFVTLRLVAPPDATDTD